MFSQHGSPFLISNFTKNADFFEKMAKKRCLVKKNCDKQEKIILS